MDKEYLLTIYSRYKFIIYPFVVALIGIIVILLVIYPQVNNILEKRSQMENLSQKLEFLDAKAADLENLNEADLSRKINAAVAVLPSDKDYTSTINVLQSIIQQNSFSLTSLQTGQVANVSTPNLSGFNVKIETVGPRAFLSRLLSSLENAPRVMKVSTIELVPQKSPDSVDAIISVDVFYAPIPTSLGAVDAPLSQLTDKDEELLAKLVRNVNAAGVSAVTPTTPSSLPPRGKSNPFE